MGTNELLKDAIMGVIKENGNNEITGNVLQNVLISIVNTIGENAGFAGIATPASNPGYRDSNVIYLAVTPGVYSNFNGVSLSNGEIAIIANSTGSWKKYSLGNFQSNYIDIEYGDLVRLRDTSSLIPGRFYRITDYITTTTQENTQSAGHPFDVIVLALSGSELSEEAWAIQSARDTDGYFSNSALSGWKIWYSLDNDAERFAWADTENGKGVIYRMIDEWNNDCPYDFKNIKYVVTPSFNVHTYYGANIYAVYEVINESQTINGIVYYKCSMIDKVSGPFNPPSTIWIDSEIPTSTMGIYTIENGVVSSLSYTIFNISTANYRAYTFSSLREKDASLSDSVHSNVIKQYHKDGVQRLNKNYFITTESLLVCNNNKFGNDCNNNSFGNNCYNNSFGNNCNFNRFGNDCNNNKFGNDCNNNSFGNNCYNNSFGNNCYSNSFGSSFSFNSFGNQCYSNSFGDNSNNSSFGNNCFSNTFGNNCYYNSFGNNCNFNSFGNYFRYNKVDDGVSVTLSNSQTAAYNQQVQNYHFTRGLGSRTIEVERNRAYETTVAIDSTGNVKQFCIADIIL